MKQFIFLIILAAGAIPHTVIAGPDAGSASGKLAYSHLPYGCFWYPGFPPVIQISGDGVGQVLASISSTEKRLQLAEKWFQILEQSCTRSLDLQKGWLQVQQRHLELQKQIEELRAEMLKLQVEIEKLQVEKLRLEKEKLELQLKLQKEKPRGEKGDVISGTGRISHIAVEGGFCGIVAADGSRYKPINLPKDFQKDGLRVRFKAKEKTEMVSIHMWGRIVEIIEIEKI